MVSFFLRRGLRRGLMDGSRPWLVLGGVAVGIRLLQKLSGSGPKVVLSERLHPGQTMVIAHERPLEVRGRAARRGG